ncbi:MAG: hypothetical protein U0694_10510 [Anaerolineae bacterium]
MLAKWELQSEKWEQLKRYLRDMTMGYDYDNELSDAESFPYPTSHGTRLLSFDEIVSILHIIAERTGQHYKTDNRLRGFEKVNAQGQVIKTQYLFKIMKGLDMVANAKSA